MRHEVSAGTQVLKKELEALASKAIEDGLRRGGRLLILGLALSIGLQLGKLASRPRTLAGGYAPALGVSALALGQKRNRCVFAFGELGGPDVVLCRPDRKAAFGLDPLAELAMFQRLLCGEKLTTYRHDPLGGRLDHGADQMGPNA